MNVKNLVRDVGKIHADLVKLEDGRVVTRNGCKIYLPARFSERNLASVSVETHIVGIFAIVVEDKYYSTMLINAMVSIDPVITNRVVIHGDEYYEFVFNPGSTVIKSTQLVKSNKLVYHVYDELIGKGRMPWYMSYLIQARIFDTALYHAGANIGQDHVVTELLISMIARNPQDRTQYYRQIVRKPEDLETTPPAMIPLKSVAYSATNTTNRLAGSYMKDGIVSSLVSPTERTERIEGLLRM